MNQCQKRKETEIRMEVEVEFCIREQGAWKEGIKSAQPVRRVEGVHKGHAWQRIRRKENVGEICSGHEFCNNDRLAVRLSRFLVSSCVRSHSFLEGKSSWSLCRSEVSEVLESGVLVLPRFWRFQGSELELFHGFKMVRDYNEDSLEKDQAGSFVMLASGRGKHEHKVKSKVQGKYISQWFIHN